MDVRVQSSQPSKEFAIIERIARIVSSVRGAKSDYTHLAAELEQAVPFDIFGIVLLRHDRQSVRVTVCHRDDDNGWIALHHQHLLVDSFLDRMLHTHQLWVQEYPDGLAGTAAECGDALSGYLDLRSTLIAPLIVGDQVIGTLELGSVETQIYNDKSLQSLVEAVASVLATAIESVQLGGNTAIQDRQRRVLKNVISALTEQRTDLPSILNQIVTGIAEALNVPSCICLWDRQKHVLYVEASSGLDSTAVNNVFQHGLPISDNCILGQALIRRQSCMSNDIADDQRYPNSAVFFHELGLRSLLAYPLTTGTTDYGVLVLCSTESGGFTPLKADILGLFANQATVALHNAVMLDSAQQRHRFHQAIDELEQAHQRQRSTVGETQQSQQESLMEELELLNQVREETQKTFGFSFSSILRLISDYLLTQSERDPHPRVFSASSTPVREGDLFPLNPQALTQQPQYPHADMTGQHHMQQPFAETLSVLAQTAESALSRAGMVGELGRLLLQLQHSTSGVRDAWFVVDLNGTCTYMNPAAEDLCNVQLGPTSVPYNMTHYREYGHAAIDAGLSIENVFAKLLSRIRNREEVEHYLHAFARGRSTYRQELRCVVAVDPEAARTPHRGANDGRTPRHDGASGDKYYQFIRYPLHNQQGRLAASALQVQNITEQVRDERNRSTLLSSVSHDLRTPLTTIKAAVSGLRQEELGWSESDRQEMLEDIERETDHLTVLVNALVELSRIEMGALILECEWCDVKEVFYGTLEKVKRAFRERTIVPHLQEDLPLIYVDHVQLERIFYNLIENALRHSGPDTNVDVFVETIGESPQILRTRVIDYGKGVPEGEQERIFKSYTLRGYGNGMSLAICKGLVEAHQGSIWYDKTFTSGACFVFTLPIHPHTMVPIDDAFSEYTRAMEQGETILEE